MKKIEWITFNAFLDTDMYIIKELSKYYLINWHIIKSGNENIDYISEISELEKIDNLTVTVLECGKRLRKLECVRSYNTLLDNINKSKPDVIYLTLAGAPYFIPISILKLNLNKVLLAIHNVHVPKGGTSYYFFKIYNYIAIKFFKNFQTFSKNQLDVLMSMAPNKNMFYVDFLMKDYGDPTIKRADNKITFLNFGNIRKYKRLDVLILAAQEAYEETKIPFKVIIAGKCDDWTEYEKLIKYDFLFDVRLGRVENNDVPNLFELCDYFVAPYQDIAQSGSATVSINYEKPVIASKLPAFEEYLVDGETGYFMSPANITSLKNIIINILHTHELNYKNLVRNVKSLKENKFSTQAIVKKYREAIDDFK